MAANPVALRPRRRSAPGAAENGFAAVGLIALLAASFTIPVPAEDVEVRAITSLFTLAAGAVLAALPALLFRGVYGDWKGFMLWYGRGLIALALVVASGVVHRGLTEPPSSLLESLRGGQTTIDRFVRAERAAAPGMFDQRLLATHERALRQSFPDGRFSDVSLLSVTDGAGWLRAHMTYQALLTVQGEPVSTRGQMVVYYHRAGTAVIAAACTADERDCRQIEPLLAAAERSLRTRFDAADLDGVLPGSRECSVETVAVPNSEHESQVRACVYAPGIQLTLTRLDGAATIASLVAERAGTR
jgi:hypothetical protein